MSFDVTKWCRRTLAYHVWSSYRGWRFRTHELPKLKFADIEGVRLQISELSLDMREVIVEGRYEVAEMQLCRDLLTDDDRIVEIGSAIGFLGIFVATKLGIRDYFSVEANPETADLLKGNYALNGLQPHVFVAALAGQDGPLELNVTKDFWTNSICAKPNGSMTKRITVQGYRLSTLLDRIPFSPTTLIIDVEGAETVLTREAIPEGIKKMIIELHPRVIGTTGAFEVLKHLMNQGFKVFAGKDDSYALVRGSVNTSG